MTYGGTYPRAEGKREQPVVSGTVHLPPLEGPKRVLSQGGGKERSSGSARKQRPVKSSGSSNPAKKKRNTEKNLKQHDAPVESVMSMNKKAMALMKDGKMKASQEMLEKALTTAEAGVRRLPSRAADTDVRNEEQREAWLLAFAATLSNLGCLRRRNNELHDAIRYLRDARNVETEVFGRPSCSTMVNLSAVLLGLGSKEEALAIARDCTVASEGSDPMLHIIAQHNYGIILSQHPAEEMRQSATSVLMKALREAQTHLGEEHPTTVRIREHCGLTLGKTKKGEEKKTTEIGCVASETRAGRRSIVGTSNPPLPSGNSLPPISQMSDHIKEAQEALKRLNYGDMPLVAGNNNYYSSAASAASADKQQQEEQEQCGGDSGKALKGKEATAPISVVSIGREGDEAVTRKSVGRHSPDESVSTIIENDVERVLREEESSGFISTDIIHLTVLKESPVEGDEDTTERSTIVKSASKRIERDNGASAVIQCLMELDKEIKDDMKGKIIQRSRSSLYEEEGNMNGEEDPQVKENEGTFDPNKFDVTQRPVRVKIPGGFVVIGSEDPRTEPSFYRFAPPDMGLTPNTSTRESNLMAASADKQQKFEKNNTNVMMEFKGREGDKDEEEEDEEDVWNYDAYEYQFKEGSAREKRELTTTDDEKATGKKRKAFLRRLGVDPATRRKERILQEYQEEEILRARIQKEAEEKARKEYFERTLEAIITRTRDRAARKIQYEWCMWWNSVGKRRRELIIKRAEEKARRERSRQALLDHEQRVKEELRRERMSRKRTETEIIPSVLKCGKKWLEKSACVRYMARKEIPLGDRNETFFVLQLSKIQALWRGYSVRREMKNTFSGRKEVSAYTQELEREEYAAMVIQMFIRRCFARKQRALNAMERYEPPAIKIQRWIRVVMPYRRSLGKDRVSMWRKEYSARLIQRTWRAYLQRLAFFMARLRYRLDEDKRKERDACCFLQRVCRGFICRLSLARYWLQSARVHTAVYSLEWAGRDMGEKRETVATVPKSIPASVYVPTPIKEVEAIAELEREKYHIGLFVDVVAERTRAEWKEALLLRPFEVLRRRANEDHLCQIELNASRRERAAVKIQREFRQWRRIRHDPFRDNTLLLISRGDYQATDYGRKIDRIRHERELTAGTAIYGDQTAPMRVARAEAREELQEVVPLVRTHVRHDQIRSRLERLRVEEELQRDEALLEKQLYKDALEERRESRLRQAIEAGVIASRENRIKAKLIE